MMRRKLVGRPLGARRLERVHRTLVDDAERFVAADEPARESTCPHSAFFLADRVDP
jgi:hypothetical protein